MYAKNKYELSRGFIISTFIWVGLFIFIAIWNIQSEIYWWAIPRKTGSKIVFLSLLLFEAYWTFKILHLLAYKLTKNRFRYFPNEKIDNITSKNEKE